MSHLILDRMGADRPEALATGEAGTVYLCHLMSRKQRPKRRRGLPTDRLFRTPPLFRRLLEEA